MKQIIINNIYRCSTTLSHEVKKSAITRCQERKIPEKPNKFVTVRSAPSDFPKVSALTIMTAVSLINGPNYGDMKKKVSDFRNLIVTFFNRIKPVDFTEETKTEVDRGEDTVRKMFRETRKIGVEKKSLVSKQKLSAKKINDSESYRPQVKVKYPIKEKEKWRRRVMKSKFP